jgi:hypothetical protein
MLCTTVAGSLEPGKEALLKLGMLCTAVADPLQLEESEY